MLLQHQQQMRLLLIIQLKLQHPIISIQKNCFMITILEQNQHQLQLHFLYKF